MKFIAILLITIACTQAMNVTQLKDFTMGVAVGAKAADKVSDAFACISNVTASVEHFKQAAELLKSSNMTEKYQGFKLILGDLLPMVNDIEGCSGAVQQGKSWSDEVAHAFSTAELRAEGYQRLVTDSEKVGADFTKLSQGLLDEQYFMAGLALGDVLQVFVYPQTQLNFLALRDVSNHQGLQLMKEYLEL